MSINPIDLFLPSTNVRVRSSKPALSAPSLRRPASKLSHLDIDAICGFKPLANMTANNTQSANISATTAISLTTKGLPRLPLPSPSAPPAPPPQVQSISLSIIPRVSLLSAPVHRPLAAVNTAVALAASSSSSLRSARQTADGATVAAAVAAKAVTYKPIAENDVAATADPPQDSDVDSPPPKKRIRKRKAVTAAETETEKNPKRSKRTSKKRSRDESEPPLSTATISSVTSTNSKRQRRTVSSNYVRTNLRKKSRAFHRGMSAKSRRHQAFLQRRGSTWLPYKKWKAQTEEQKQNSLYIESLSAADTRKAVQHDHDDDEQAGESTADELEELLVIERADMSASPPSTVDNGIRSVGDGQYSTEYLQSILHSHFGYETFRYGQLECIHSLLSLAPMRTLLSLPTAQGKSLCALLPALLLPNMTVIVSPLLSLMHDQCRSLPPSLKGAVWGGDMAADAVIELMEEIRCNKLKVLFVSVEKCTSPSFTDFLATLSSPPSMIVIDEAHCLSQWSHNFRSAYLHLPRFIDSLPYDTRVLAMSATCTKRTQREMALSLKLEHIVHRAQVRDNIRISVLKINEHDRPSRLVDMIKPLMRGPCKVRSILVYVPFQKSAEFYASHLTNNGVTANAYHAGLPFKTRQRVHAAFANGTIRVLCATISFGMGIDIGHIDCVIHLHVPSSLESYVQEIGRCGRDGRPSSAICLYTEDDIRRVHSMSRAQAMEPSTIRRIVDFAIDFNVQQLDGRDGTYIAIPLQLIEDDCAVTPEVAATVLSHVALADSASPHIQTVAAAVHNTVRIGFHRTKPSALAERLPLFKAVLELSECDANGRYTVHLTDLCNRLSARLSDIQRDLVRMRSLSEISLFWSDQSFIIKRFRVCADDHARDNLVETVTQRIRLQEDVIVQKAAAIDLAIGLVNAGQRTMTSLCDEYFAADDETSFIESLKSTLTSNEHQTVITDQSNESESALIDLQSDIVAFLRANTTVRRPADIARHMHGVKGATNRSALSSSVQYGWAMHRHIPFDTVKLYAQKAIIRFHHIHHDDDDDDVEVRLLDEMKGTING